jgi:phosphatidylglycerol:prolipoprotein diacylglycerol transferase
MFPVLQIGHVAVQTPGLILILGLWAGLDLAERYFRKLGIQPSKAYTLVTIGLATAVVGGRLSYAAENFSAFAVSPASLISLNVNLWDLPGGVILGLAGSIGYGLRHKMDFWSLLDSLSPSFAVMMIAFALADLASGSAFGEPVRLPWSIFLWGEWRHPSQVYETLGAVSVLIWVLVRASRLDPNSPLRLAAGALFLEFVAGSAVWRIFLEMFRGDGSLLLGQIRAAQVVAWIILALALFFRGKRMVQNDTSSQAETPLP